MKSNFRYLSEKLHELGITEVDGILFDLGVSSPQLDTPGVALVIIMMHR